MFVRESIGLHLQQNTSGNPAAFVLGIRPSDLGYADLYACLGNGSDARIGDGRTMHEPKAPAWGQQDGLGKNRTFKTAESQNRECQSHRKRVWV